MAERSNAAVLKTVVRLSVDRGFESLFLRQSHQSSPGRQQAAWIFVLGKARAMDTWARDFPKTKTTRRGAALMALKLPTDGITDERSEEVIRL